MGSSVLCRRSICRSATALALVEQDTGIALAAGVWPTAVAVFAEPWVAHLDPTQIVLFVSS